MRGGSRGGTVALLAGIRDKRIKKIVNVAGPANLMELASVSEQDPTYQCQFLASYKNNNSTLAETRFRLIASSPFYFAQYLPPTQVHLGLNDKRVPVQQGYDLQQKMNLLGMGSDFQLFVYSKTHDDIAINNPEMIQRIEAFLAP